MPRYVIERSFPDGLEIPEGDPGLRLRQAVVEKNTDEGVTWIQSYLSDDKRAMYCVYDGPSPEAIRRAATANQLPVDRITEVRVVDPYPQH